MREVGTRIGWCVAVGTLVGIGDPVWFHLPWRHALGNLGFQLVAWLVLGLAVATAMRATARD